MGRGLKRLAAGSLAIALAGSLTMAVWPVSSSQHPVARVRHSAPSSEHRSSADWRPASLPPLHSRRLAVDLLQPKPFARFDLLGVQEPDISKVNCVLPADAPQKEDPKATSFLFDFDRANCMSFPELLVHLKKNPFDKEAVKLMIELLPELDEFMPEQIRSCDYDFLVCERARRNWVATILFESNVLIDIINHAQSDSESAALFTKILQEGQGGVLSHISLYYTFGTREPVQTESVISFLSSAGLINPQKERDMLQSSGCRAYFSFFEMHPDSIDFLGYTQEDISRQCDR